jgi:hypothetical protein
MAQESRPTSNYAGASVLTLNPAELADNRYKASVNLGSLYVDYQNNFARWVAPHSYVKAGLNGDKYPGDYKILDKKVNKNVSLNARIAGPSITYSLPSLKIGIAAGVNQRVFADMQGASNATATFLYKGLYYRPQHSIEFQDETFKFNFGGYNEFFFSAAYVLKEEGSYAIKIGATLKKLSSNLNFNINADDLDYRVEESISAQDRTKSDIFFKESIGSFTNASVGFDPSLNWAFNQLTSLNGIGNGYGADIGFVYEYRPDAYKYKKKSKLGKISDPKVNKYKWKFGAGLQDFGYLKFSDPGIQVSNVNAGTSQIISGDFEDVNTPNDFTSIIENNNGLNPATYGNSFNVLMPAAIIAHADLSLGKDFYLSAVWRQSLLSRCRIGPHLSSYIMITPRYERKWFEIMVPLAIGNYYNNVNFGITGRVGFLFFGITDLTLNSPIFNSRGIAGEVGLSIPFFYTEPKSPLACFGQKKKRLFFSEKRKNKPRYLVEKKKR